MSNLELVLELAELAETQNRLIKAMALRLGELGDVSCRDELAEADRAYKALLGAEP